jgi:hypothetical protein
MHQPDVPATSNASTPTRFAVDSSNREPAGRCRTPLVAWYAISSRDWCKQSVRNARKYVATISSSMTGGAIVVKHSSIKSRRYVSRASGWCQCMS